MTAAAGPVAYLSGEYPRPSDTFIQREVVALRAMGLEVLTCSVRRTPAAQHVSEFLRAEAAGTFHVLEAARAPRRLLAAHAAALRRSPRRWLGTLALAWRTRPPGLKAALWQLFYFAEAGVLAAHLRAHGVRHLHNHFGDSSGSVAMLAAELAQVPFSLTIHGPSIFFEAGKWRLDEKAARARFVACISHFCRSQVMLFADPGHWPKLHIVHCGIEPARYAGAGHGAPGKRLLFVGRLAAVKGVPVLLEAFARLRARHPEAHLTLVGDGPERARLEAGARAAGLDGAVSFAGYRGQDEVAELLAQSDIFVLPSFAEGVPVVLMEAMASGLPVVATRVGGVAELVEDGRSGLLVNAGDAADLEARLGLLLDDPARGRAMGAAGRAAVAAEFDIAREARRLAALIEGRVPPDRVRPGA